MQRLKHILGRFAGRPIGSGSRRSRAREFHDAGVSLSKAGRWGEALQAYRNGLSLAPRDVELWRALLDAPKEAGYAEPVKALLATLDPELREGGEHGHVIALNAIDDTQLLAARYTGLQFRDRDVGQLDTLLNGLRHGGHVDLRFFKSLSDYFWENGPVEHALLPSELYLREHRHLHLLFRASEIYAITGDNEERRIGYLEEIVQCDAASAMDYLIIGSGFRRLRRWGQAFKAYEDGLRLSPDDMELWRAYAETSAVAGSVDNFVKSFVEHRPNIAEIIAAHPSHSAVYFIKHLKRQGAIDICDQIADLIIERLTRESLDEAIKHAMTYIVDSTAVNDFELRDRFCDGFIERWSGQHDEAFSKAAFRLRLIKLFSLPIVFDQNIDDEGFVRTFCSECEKLTLEAIELDDPVADLGRLPPWVAIYTRAVPHLYSDAISALRTLCERVWPRLAWTAPHVGGRDRPSSTRMKIGFTCLDVMPMISGLMDKLDASKFERIYLRPAFDGPVTDTAQDWVARADRTVDLPAESVYAVQEAIAREELDVIVAGPSLPLSIYPMMARLASLQMTIIEPNWCDNFPNVDYYISWGRAEPADFKTYHKSAAALMQHPPYWLEMPPQANKPVSTAARVLADAPAHKRVYVCPTQPAKLHPSFDEILRKVLLRDPDGIVVFLRMNSAVGEAVQHRMRESLGQLTERILFLPRLSSGEAHALLDAVDCVLDAHPLGGMSSSFIAAANGVPTVSLPVEMPFGKWMSAIYDYIGVKGLTARSPDEYAEIAYRLASDAAWREAKASEIRAKRNLLVESEASAAEFEAFILDAMQRHADGLRPTDWVQGRWAEN
jgi:tetratricopeptide (TPR) repeat protein